MQIWSSTVRGQSSINGRGFGGIYLTDVNFLLLHLKSHVLFHASPKSERLKSLYASPVYSIIMGSILPVCVGLGEGFIPRPIKD